MKIKHFAFAATFLAALSLSSCSSESETPGNVNVETQQLTFSIAIPKGDPVTYATHDAAEYSIESLWMYEFDAAGTLLSAPTNIKSSLSGVGPEYTYSKTVAATDKGIRRFVFVANEQVSGITTGNTIAELEAKVAGKVLSANASSSTLLNTFSGNGRIPMTGEAVSAGSNLIPLTGTNPTIKVEMTRILARLDITNNVPNLVITDVKLANTNSSSYLFLTGDYTNPSSNTKVSGITPFSTLPSSFAQGTTMAKAFYLYEGAQPAAESDALHVQVSGKLNGSDVFYSIPFYKDNTAVTVKRNHIYKLVLKDANVSPAPNTKLTYTIEDTPWNEITLNQEVDAIGLDVYGYYTYTYDRTTQTLTVPNTELIGNQMQMRAYPIWKDATVTIEVVDAASNPWITLNRINNASCSIRVTANTTGAARTVKIKVTTDKSTTEVRYLTVTQNP